MLRRAFEWYQIVNVKPASQTIDDRIAAAKTILTMSDQAEHFDLLLDCAVGVVAGFDANFTQGSPTIESLVNSIRAHDSAFPEDLSENALELRACAAIALGEIMVRHGDQEPQGDALLIASVLRSGLGTRPAVKGRHLKRLLDELEVEANKVLTSGAISRRRRLVGLEQRLEELQESEASQEAWEPISALKEALKEISQQFAIDREELDILWWMFAGVSSITDQPIAELPSGAAALCCGAELGNKCLVPPTSSLEAMVRQACENRRRPQEKSDRSIEKIVEEWGDLLPKLLVPNEDAQYLAKEYPVLFPLSWLCDRLLASKGAANWSSEFERMTGISSTHACPPAAWAIQVFRERVAQRMHEDNCRD